MATIRPGVLELNPREFSRIVEEDAVMRAELDRFRSDSARLGQLVRRCGERCQDLLAELATVRADNRRLHHTLGTVLDPSASVEDWADAMDLHRNTVAR